MLVPDQIRECTCFAFARIGGELRAVGTVFFVGVPLGETGMHGPFLVTALHVLGKAEIEGDGSLYMRVNTRDGSFAFVGMGAELWHRPDQSERLVDVVVAPWSFGLDRFEFKRLTAADFASRDVIRDEAIGVGDDVFLAGLFVSHHGRRRNVPIVRVGNIAAMPAEPVKTKLGPTEAYLVEARSVGGLSGSPVFVYLGTERQDARGDVWTRPVGSRMWYLLGVMHGHFDWERDRQGENAAVTDLMTEYVNMGVGIVTPLAALIDLLRQPSVLKLTEAATRRVEERQAARQPPAG